VSSQLRTDVALGMSVSGSQINPRVPARVSRGSANARVELIRFARPCGLIWGEWIALDGSSFAWRLGWADEIAAAVAYLFSSLAAYASGTVLQVDGGHVRSAR
jgi:NAD(P)-dependent dehydrogenase (short-subunit alcohol dehydrogenase family)